MVDVLVAKIGIDLRGYLLLFCLKVEFACFTFLTFHLAVTVGERQGCGGRVNVTTTGVINPIRGANGQYLSNLDCTWILTAADNKVFSLQVSGIEIEAGQSGTCGFDGLEVSVVYLLFSRSSPHVSTVSNHGLEYNTVDSSR